MTSKEKGYVLITGASNGIGLALAELYAKEGYSLIIVGRNKEKTEGTLDFLNNKSPINTQGKHQAIIVDLEKPLAARQIYEQLADKKDSITHLINNAGFGDYDLFIDSDLAKITAMLDVNIKVVLELTHLLLPHLKKMTNHTKEKFIMNVASVAAFQPGPFMATYYASKAFILSFSEALAKELRKDNIFVSTLCPGPTKTAFDKVAGRGAEALFARMSTHSPEFVAQYAFAKLANKKHLIIPGLLNKIMVQLPRFLPRKLILASVYHIQKMRK